MTVLQGRRLAHLEGRRYDSLNRSEWFTLLFAREDGVLEGWTRRIRRRLAWRWLRAELASRRADYDIHRRPTGVSTRLL